MIFRILLAVVPVGIVLLCSEYVWRREILKGERARKFIHILAGVWMAFWPYYVGFDGIVMLGTFAFTLLVYSRMTSLFHAIYAVKRRTYGELFFAVAVVVCAYVSKEPWVFMTSMLLLAVADGGAAVVGRVWGVSNQYKVFGTKQLIKSRAGTAAYVILAFASMVAGYMLGGQDALAGNWALFAGVPVGMAVIENISPYGLDNLTIPILATVVFNTVA